MKILSSYVVPNLYEFLSSAELFDYPCSSKYLLCSAEEEKNHTGFEQLDVSK